MDLNKYFKEKKDEIHSTLVEFACDLAVVRLMKQYKKPFSELVEPEDPDDPEGGTSYKEEYQNEFDEYYDEEYARLADVIKFDYLNENGVAE